GVVENCPRELINGASIDVTLGAKILRELSPPHDVEDAVDELLHGPSRVARWPIDFRARQPLRVEEIVLGNKAYQLAPGEFILAATEQLFHLPPDIAMELRMKSSAARIGINHSLAGWADPTWHGSALTLELKNETRYHTLLLRPGDRIAQVIFHRCAPVP